MYYWRVQPRFQIRVLRVPLELRGLSFRVSKLVNLNMMANHLLYYLLLDLNYEMSLHKFVLVDMQ